MISKIKAVTFDDFFTLHYPIGESEDIIYPILKALKSQGVDIEGEEFLKHYFKADQIYRKKLAETFHESLLDDIVMSALIACGHEQKTVDRIAKEAVDYGLTTRKAKWFPNAKRTLLTLRKKGYKLGLISNTHWRVSESLRKEFRKFFDILTLSYEHGHAKPHLSIFVVTLKKLKTSANCCLHVGDDPIADIRGAKSIGMKTAFIQRTDAEADADVKIKRLIELTTFL